MAIEIFIIKLIIIASIIEVPRGISASISRALVKSTSKMMLSSSDKFSWATKAIKSLEREHL